MAYEKINWENAPSKKTPINDRNLNHMDAGIAENSEQLEQLCGINLFDKDNVIINYYLDYETNLPIWDGNMAYTPYYIPVKSNTNYTMSYSSATIFIIYEYDKDKNYLRYNAQNDENTYLSLSFGEDVAYVKLGCGKICIDSIQFEKGSEPTSYQPYHKITYNNTDSMGNIKVDSIKGKNLFNPEMLKLGIYSSGTVVDFITNRSSFETISFYAHQDKGDFFPFQIVLDDLETNTDYTVSGIPNNQYFTGVYAYTNNLWGNNIGSGNIRKGFTFNTGSVTKVVLGLYSTSNVIGEIREIRHLQIEKGTNSTKYVPYMKYGYNSETSMGDITVDSIVNKNLYNKDTDFDHSYYSADGTLNSNTYNANSVYIEIDENTNYTLSFNQVVNSFTVAFFDSNKTFLSRSSNFAASSEATFMTPEQAKYLRFAVNYIDGTVMTKTILDSLDIQLERGTIKTDYTPYMKYGYNSINSMGKLAVDDISSKNIWNGTLGQNGATTVNTSVYAVQPNTTYIWSSSASNLECINYFKDENKTDISDSGVSLMPKTFTTPSNCYFVQTSFVKPDRSNIIPSEITELQLEKGDKATSYTPYKKFGYNENESMGNIVVDNISCKNLLNKYDLIDGSYYAADVLTHDSNMCYTKTFIEVVPGENYIFSCDTSSTVFINEYDTNGAYIKSNTHWEQTSVLFTASSTTKYIYISISISAKDTAQLERGTKPTSYTPYKNFEGRTDIITGQECPTNEYLDGKRVYRYRKNLGTAPSETGEHLYELGIPNYDDIEIVSYELFLQKSTDYTTEHIPYIAYNFNYMVVGQINNRRALIYNNYDASGAGYIIVDVKYTRK